jgi:hypothetical protein
MRESEIVSALESHLHGRGDIVLTELAVLQRRIDLVAFSPVSNTLTAVEAKVKNWRIAFKQAIPCLLFADEVYIALPQEFSHRVDPDVLQRYGIGLIRINSSIETIIPPVKSPYRHAYYRKLVMNSLMNSAHTRERYQHASG